MLETVGALVVVLDRKGGIVRFNRACEALTGYRRDEVRGKSLFNLLIPKEQRSAVRKVFRQLAGGNFPNVHENLWLTKSGEPRLIEWRNTAICDRGGAVEYVIGTGLDVTEERRAQAEKDVIAERLRESEVASRELLETAAQAIIAIDQGERIVRVNEMACRMFGYSRDELLGRKLGILLPRGVRRAHSKHVAGFLEKPERRPMGMGRDLQGRRKDGSVFPIEVGLSAVRLDETSLSVAFISDITARKAAEEKIAVQNERLQQLTRRLTSRVEKENRTWARELHDVYSQRLVGLAMALAQARSEAAPPDSLAQIEDQVRTLAEDIHQLSRRMHPSILHDLGLAAALRSEAFAFQREHGIETTFEAGEVPSALSDAVALCFYRVAQETLRNIRKHSGARSAHLSVGIEGETLVMTIRDEGDGFDLDRALRKGGLGLISMEERVLSIGGDFSIRSVPEVGTTVRVSVPLGELGASASV